MKIALGNNGLSVRAQDAETAARLYSSDVNSTLDPSTSGFANQGIARPPARRGLLCGT